MEPSTKIEQISKRFVKNIAVADSLLEKAALNDVLFVKVDKSNSYNVQRIAIAMLHAEGYIEPVPTNNTELLPYCITIKGYRRVMEHLNQQKSTDPLRGQRPPSAF